MGRDQEVDRIVGMHPPLHRRIHTSKLSRLLIEGILQTKRQDREAKLLPSEATLGGLQLLLLADLRAVS